MLNVNGHKTADQDRADATGHSCHLVEGRPYHLDHEPVAKGIRKG